ncbi:hypothetical protein IQ07DRAFT_631794 [Pyrenochaeta sp. DS3sAY3a]|nr:hypothetical protein IQ07DRAFT_631794 [Pyrenochaeta sp. DS3sAY3a]
MISLRNSRRKRKTIMFNVPVTRACDRCHRLKERCIRLPTQDGSCVLCKRLDHRCTTRRTAQPRGRPSQGCMSPNTHSLCWIQEQGSSEKSSKDQSGKRCFATSLPARHRSSATVSPLSYSTSILQPTFKASSPRCHSQLMSSPNSTTAQEMALKLLLFSPSPETHLSMPLCPTDDVLLESMLDRDQFLQYFTLGQGFTENFRSLGYTRFCESKEFIHEGSLACAGAVFHARAKSTGFQDTHFARSAVGLRKLRGATVTKSEVAPCLTLGMSLATFELITSGKYVHSITRFTLSLVHPLYSFICGDPGLHSQALSLIFMDTLECLLRRRIPIIRYKECEVSVVDRLVGLCAPLLPIIHDICYYAYMMNESQMKGTQELHLAELDRLVEMVTNWEPRPFPAEMAARLSAQEKIHLLSHARAFKKAITLVIHRLKYPFGVEDSKANMLSTEIFAEFGIDLCQETGNERKTMPQTMVPWMIAAFEVTHPERRYRLLHMELPTSREILRLPAARMKDTVQGVWMRRDISKFLLLFDALETKSTYILPL